MCLNLMNCKYQIKVLCFLLKSPVSSSASTFRAFPSLSFITDDVLPAGRRDAQTPLVVLAKQSRDSALRDAGETSDATPSPAKPAAQNDSQSSRIQPHNTTAPPAPTLHHHRSRHGLLIRLPSSTRLACDSYAPHPSPGIPHEQPQHVFC